MCASPLMIRASSGMVTGNTLKGPSDGALQGSGYQGRQRGPGHPGTNPLVAPLPWGFCVSRLKWKFKCIVALPRKLMMRTSILFVAIGGFELEVDRGHLGTPSRMFMQMAATQRSLCTGLFLGWMTPQYLLTTSITTRWTTDEPTFGSAPARKIRAIGKCTSTTRRASRAFMRKAISGAHRFAARERNTILVDLTQLKGRQEHTKQPQFAFTASLLCGGEVGPLAAWLVARTPRESSAPTPAAWEERVAVRRRSWATRCKSERFRRLAELRSRGLVDNSTASEHPQGGNACFLLRVWGRGPLGNRTRETTGAEDGR